MPVGAAAIPVSQLLGRAAIAAVGSKIGADLLKKSPALQNLDPSKFSDFAMRMALTLTGNPAALSVSGQGGGNIAESPSQLQGGVGDQILQEPASERSGLERIVNPVQQQDKSSMLEQFIPGQEQLNIPATSTDQVNQDPVVRSEGEKIRAFHVGPKDIKEFKLGKEVPRISFGTKENVEFLQKAGAKGGKIHEVELDIKNPFITDNGNDGPFISTQRVEELKEQGFDGVIWRGGEETIVFDPSQVKLVQPKSEGVEKKLPLALEDSEAQFGLTQLVNDEVVIFGGTRTQGISADSKGRKLNYRLFDRKTLGEDGFPTDVGEADLVVNHETGKITEITNIKIKEDVRDGGLGRKFVESIRQTNPDVAIKVNDVDKEAIGFWEKLGAKNITTRGDKMVGKIDMEFPALNQPKSEGVEQPLSQNPEFQKQLNTGIDNMANALNIPREDIKQGDIDTISKRIRTDMGLKTFINDNGEKVYRVETTRTQGGEEISNFVETTNPPEKRIIQRENGDEKKVTVHQIDDENVVIDKKRFNRSVNEDGVIEYTRTFTGVMKNRGGGMNTTKKRIKLSDVTQTK
jgi:hypothetical protein